MRARAILGILVLMGLLGTSSMPALALPSYLGPSGLIFTPDAQANGFSAISFSAHFFDLSGALKNYGVDGGTNVYAATYSPLPALELGVSSMESETSDRATMLNGKLVISEQSTLQPFAFVAGIIDALDEQEISPYILASKRFNLSGPFASNQISLAVNAGYGGGFFNDGLVLGGELKVHPQFSIIAEGTKEYINLGARFSAAGLSLDLGVVDMQDFATGVSYSWAID
ncbi:MAG: hypothetical protein A2Y63_05985 [Candidatus Riflebacteria bacterium RBG_13_59_9]|nr:MAG: hypothetical protein A2Y63_05985 [Candidatus Riflebacteria bacterium RBG_13_59_9]